MSEKIKIKDLPSKESVLETDIFVESDATNTYKVTAEDIATFVIDSDALKNAYVDKSTVGTNGGVAPLNSDGKIEGSYIQYGTTFSTAYEGSAGKILETNLDNHLIDENAHGYNTKIGEETTRATNAESTLTTNLNNEVTRAKSAEKANADNISAEINRATDAENNLDLKKADKTSVYTKNEVDNKFSALETNIDWKESVETFDDIATTYPSPVDGWTVNTKDTDYTYRYNGVEWVAISANAIPKATNSVDGILSKEDHTNYEDANSKKHTHDNKSIIDKITQSLLDAWNSAVTHISDTVRHITSSERNSWNTAYNHSQLAHAPSNAQENVIETVKVNGTALTPSSKSVNVVIPTKVSELTNDSGFKTTDNNTTYSLSKSGSTITLTGSDGSTTSVTDSSGSGGSAVSFSQNLVSGTKVGTLTIDGTATDLYAPTNTDTHYTTGLKVGASNTATSNASATNGNVYMNVLDNTTVRDSHKIVGSGATTVTSDANGVITIASTDTKYTHPTTSGNKHIPSGGSSGQVLTWSADGTAVWGESSGDVGQIIASSEPTGQKTGDHWLKEF